MEMDVVDLLFRTPVLFFFFQVALTTSVVHFLQQYLRRDRPENHYIEEFFCVIQTMVISYECGVMRTAYGDVVYAICLFGTALFYTNIFRSDIFTNPAGTFFSYSIDNRMTTRQLFYHFLVQIAGSWIAFEYIRAIWSISLMDNIHKEKLVNLAVGMAVEFLITFTHRILLRGQRFLPQPGAIAGLANVICTFAGLNYTGAYFNPSQALIQQSGCVGHGFQDVFAVFIAAPLIAAFLAAKCADVIWENMRSQPVSSQLEAVPSTIL